MKRRKVGWMPKLRKWCCQKRAKSIYQILSRDYFLYNSFCFFPADTQDWQCEFTPNEVVSSPYMTCMYYHRENLLVKRRIAVYKDRIPGENGQS